MRQIHSTDPFTGSVDPVDLSQPRVVHLDQYPGNVLINMSYADYGPPGKVPELGISTHMDQQFGIPDQTMLAIACAAIILLALDWIYTRLRDRARVNRKHEPDHPFLYS
jgi:uncharacterized iron-regulated membrane protein